MWFRFEACLTSPHPFCFATVHTHNGSGDDGSNHGHMIIYHLWTNKSILPYIDGLDWWWWCHFLGTLRPPYYKPSIASMQQPIQVLLLTKLISLWPQCINLWMAAFSRKTEQYQKGPIISTRFLKVDSELTELKQPTQFLDLYAIEHFLNVV